VRPEIIYCSPAVRTRQTLDCLLDALGSPPVMFDDLLYGASVDELIGVARRTPAAFASAMFVGHNPGMGDLVGALTRSYAEFPTGAFATLAVAHTDWAELATAELRSVVVPRQLRAPD
jgi:phosphohistidine phosphatase